MPSHLPLHHDRRSSKALREDYRKRMLKNQPERIQMPFWEHHSALRMALESSELYGRILSIGGESGEAAILLARGGNEVIGYCDSPEMVDTARQLQANEKEDVQHRLKFDYGNEKSLPYANESFDSVLWWHGLSFEPHPTTMLKEIARVLKPGASLVVAVPERLHEYDANHVQIFDTDTLEQLLGDYFETAIVQKLSDSGWLTVVCRNSQSMVYPRIICMMNIKNEDRWLREVLDSIARVADGIVVLDDGSTDQTSWICGVHPAIVDYYRQENVPLDKVRDKNRILQMTLAQNPDWILCLDGDEVLEDSATRRIFEVIRTCPPDVSTFDFEFLYMWNSRRYRRTDGIYNKILHPCLFRLAGQNLQTIGFLPTDHGGNLHCERVPKNLRGRSVEADVKVIHLGYMFEENRRRKYDWNKTKDPKYANQGYYEHLLDQPGQTLEEWHERPLTRKTKTPEMTVLPSANKQEIKPEYYYANARRNLVDLVPPTAKRVLDVGCGQGMTGGLLRAERKIEVVGLEIHPEVAKVAEQHLSRVIVGDLETMELPIADGYFDCIIMGDVLEHLVDPWTSLKKLLRVLHPAGTIIASVPNIRNLGIIKKLLEGSWTYEEWGILDKTHLRFFAYKNMLEMFDQAGLEVSLAEVVRDPLFEQEMTTPPQATTDVDTGKLLLRAVHPDDLNELTAQQFIFTGKLKQSVTTDKPPHKDQQQPEASVIIPVWNNLSYTRQCITSLFMVKEPVDFEVIVVNNGSDDGTTEFLSQLPPPVRTVTLPENLGFAKGCNAGAAVARGKYLVFLNNDTIVQPGWLKEMLACIKADSTIGLVGNLQIFPDTGNVQQCGIVCGPEQMVYSIYHNQLPADHPVVNKPREFQFIAGSCMLLERDLFSSLGGFDEAYLNSCEDVDLCMRVRDVGKKVFYCPQSKIFHFESRTVNGHPKDSANYRLFLQRWKDKMKRDDLDYMREDGFLAVDKAPATGDISPQTSEPTTQMEKPEPNSQSMPKIGVLTTYHQPCGLAKYAESLVDALQADGCEPIILAEKTDDAYGQDEPYVHRCWTRQPEGGSEIAPLVKALGIEVLHVNHGGIFALDGWLPQVMQDVRKLGVRIVTTFHSTESIAPQFTLVARYSDRIIAHHPQNEIELAAVGGPIHRFEWIPIGMAPVASTDLFEAKLKLGLDPAQKIVSTFGFVESHKGIIELILAMKPVIQHLKAHLYVLGAPHPHSSDPGYIEKCRQRAAELGIAEYVHISGEYLSDEEVEMRLQASDAIVLNYQSYRYEGSAAAMTALSSGRPVITSSVPTFDLPSALTFKLTKDFSLSEAIYDVLTNPFITQVLKKNVAEYAKTAHWNVIAQRHLEVYRKTLNEPAQTDIDLIAYYRTHPDEIYAEPLQRERVRWLKSKAEGRILEIGPATGYVSEFVGAAAAVDINRGRLAVCEALRPGIQFLYGNVIEGLPFPDKAFDQVMAPEILEHVDFDQAVTVLRECARVGKRVLITIPNADKPNYNPDLVHNYEHRWIVNRQSLDRLLSEAGCINYELDTSDDLDFYLLDIHADNPEPRARIHERAAMLHSVELDPGEPLHIAIDTSVIENPTIFDYDIAQYTTNQLRELITIRPQWTFALFGVHSQPKTSIVRDLADYSNCRYRTWGDFTNRMLEILYLPNPMSDVGKQAIESVFNSDLFVTVSYDNLYPLVFAEEALSNSADLRMRYLQHLELVKRRINLYLCSSQHTVMDLQARLQLPLAKLRVVHGGADSAFIKEVTEAERQSVLRRLNLSGSPFMLFVGTPDQRRNIVGTLLGLAAARQVAAQDYRLVIAGEIPDSLLQQVRQMATQCKLPEHAVHFTGAVTDEVLNVLYHSATALLNPSRYEGLTLSILHAMTAGLPVIAGNNSAQAESFEGAARLVDADSADQIARTIMDIHNQSDLRERLIQSGKRCSSRFTWRKTAEKTAMYLSESMLQRKRAENPNWRMKAVAQTE